MTIHRRALAAGLIAALSAPSPALALRPVRASAAAIEAGLEEGLPDVALPKDEPRIPGAILFEPHKTLHPAIDAARLSHRRAAARLQAATSDGQLAAVATAFQGAVSTWDAAFSAVQQLEQVPEVTRKRAWTSRVRNQIDPNPEYTAALAAAKDYIVAAREAAQRGFAYAQAHAPKIEITALPETSLPEPPSVSVMDIATESDLPSEAEPVPATPAPVLTGLRAARPSLKEGGELTVHFERSEWPVEQRARFLSSIYGKLSSLAVGADPFGVFRNLALKLPYRTEESHKAVVEDPDVWIMQELEAVARSRDSSQESVRYRPTAVALQTREPVPPQPPGPDPELWVGGFQRAMRFATTTVVIREPTESFMPGHEDEEAMARPLAVEEMADDLPQIVRTLARALWDREFADPPPAAAGLEEPRTIKVEMGQVTLKRLEVTQVVDLRAKDSAPLRTDGVHYLDCRGWGRRSEEQLRPMLAGLQLDHSSVIVADRATIRRIAGWTGAVLVGIDPVVGADGLQWDGQTFPELVAAAMDSEQSGSLLVESLSFSNGTLFIQTGA